MKPRIIDRLLLILLMLVLMALGLGMLAISLSFVPLGILNDIVAFPYQSAQNGWITAGIGLVLVLWALRMIIGFNRRAKKTGPATALIAKTEFGTSTITLAAIDEMVRRHCAANEKILKQDSVISVKDDKLVINLKLNLAEDTNVPEVTAALRESLTCYIENLTGIKVGDISMMVSTQPEQA